MATSAQAAPVAAFDVSLTGTIAGLASGTVTGTGGTAVLDDTGTLTMNIQIDSVTVFSDNTTTSSILLSGSLAGDTLTVTSADNTVLSCVNNSPIDGCSFISPTFPAAPNPFETFPGSIVFDLVLGNDTTFSTTEVGTSATVVYNWTLTAVPEPGTALLLSLGLGAMAVARRRTA
ncbi:MAG: PEP-CTERM sorting domain-containing protein [Myxococcota bacterium]